MTDNPFAFGNPPQGQPNMTGNPFGAMGSANAAPPQQQQSNPFGGSAYGQPDNQSVTGQSFSAYSYESSQQFAAPPQQQPPAPASYNPYGQNPFGQQASPYAPPPDQAPAPSPYAPYGAAPPQAAPDNSLVVSQYQSNPYAHPQPAYDNSMVVSQTQSNPYGAYAPSQPSTGGNPFDPFAAAPPPPPAPAPVPFDYAQQSAPPQNVPPSDDLDFFGGGPPQQAPAPPPAPAPAPVVDVASLPRYQPKSEPSSSLRGDDHPAYRNVENVSANDEIPAGSPRNKFSSELAREAPMGASPLPKAELVQKRGYVFGANLLSHDSDQEMEAGILDSLWTAHNALFFRSEADFDDWLNNPYHDQTQRNFLIKLAINFVHDLYKPNVRGYQVTQCRTKAYGNKMVRQFKLERWMDYGPTIAAAFGSYNPKEVDDLREALVECMRNTPLSGGIRATGAVRQPRNREESDRNGSDDERDGEQSPRENEIKAQETKDDEPGEEADLLDVNNWDDVPAPSAAPLYDQTPYGSAPNPYGAPAPVAAYPGYGQTPQQPYPTAGQPYQNAMVPMGVPQAYPGAPYQQPQAQQSMVPFHQEQSYPQAQAYQQPAQPQGYNPYQQQAPQDPWATPSQQVPSTQPAQYPMGY